MNNKIARLKRLGVENAEALVAIGLDTPRKIKAASDTAIKKAAGVGDAALAALRERFVKAKE